MTSRPRTLLAGALGVALLGLVGCQDEDPPTSPTEPSSSAPASAQPTDSADEPAPSTSPATSPATSPGVAAASGPELVLASSSVHAPEGWTKEDPLADYEASASRRGGGGLITLLDTEGLSGDDSLDALYQATAQTLPPKADATRQPDVLLGAEQQPAVFVTYTLPGDEDSYAVVVAEREGRSVSVNFALKPSDLQADPDLMASVLASFEWV